MPAKNQAKANDSGVNEHQAKTRLLLALWDLVATKPPVKKGDLTKRVVQKSHKAADYQGIFDQLEKQGAIKIEKNEFSLSDKGWEMLGEMLKHPEVKFEGTIVGTWVANALVRWIAQMDGSVNTPAAQAKTKEKAIASYEEFKQVALDIYDKLNRNYNLDDLVPIYRIRREIGDRVSREHFNEWLLEMQKNNIFQLMAGEMPDITPDKREDSIETPVGGLRYYAKCLIS
jgi:DNA-binding PadR family transcriptional regulator